MIPGLEERLMEGSNEDVIHIGELVCLRQVFILINLESEFMTDSEGLC
jgi:hypothetical protein